MAITTYNGPNIQGQSYAIAVPGNTSTPSTPIQLVGTSNCFLFNFPSAAGFLWLAFSPIAAQATANAVAPTAGNPQNVMLLYYGTIAANGVCVNIPSGWYVAILNSTTTATTIYVQAVN